jgi:hypothetical protein
MLGEPSPTLKPIGDQLTQRRRLPGQVSMQVVEIAGSSSRILTQLNPDQSLAIGSASKVYVLGAVVRALQSNQHPWAEVVHLDAHSVPPGTLQDWPVDSPLTFHTLAAMMVAENDGTAADRLMALLGREQLEKMLLVQGNAHVAQNAPFLSTLEEAKLKDEPGQGALKSYLKLDAAGRRSMLQGALTQVSRDSLTPPPGPVALGDVGWFASAADLNRALDWVRRNTDSGAAAGARELMAINPGVPVRKADFKYLGSVGGSEAGAQALSYLAQRQDGSWVELSLIWNQPSQPIEEERLLHLVEHALRVLTSR